MKDSRLEREIDKLYRLRLVDFVGARDALALKLQSAGDPIAAARVKRQAKPSVSAWTVNQLYWKVRRGYTRVLEAGDRVRKIQSGNRQGLDSDYLRRAVQRRREATTAILDEAARILSDAGHVASRALLRRVESTLDALTICGDSEERRPAGRWTGDLDPPGFDGLLGATSDGSTGRVPAASRQRSAARSSRRTAKRDRAPATKKATPRTRSSAGAKPKEPARLARARSGLASAEREAGRRRDEVRREEARREMAAERAQRARTEIETARRRLTQARERAARVEADLRLATANARRAAAAAHRADKMLASARARLKKAES